jgi:phospholipase/lecithinase/hemolysin
VLPGPRYYKGRFSNGLIWPDFIKSKFKIKRVENYAYGASTTDNNLSSIAKFIPSIHDSIIKYSKKLTDSCGYDKTDYLVAYSGGMNDYFNISTNPYEVVNNIERDLKTLIKELQFEQILVSNLPPAYLSPNIILSKDPQRYNLIKLRVLVHNNLLKKLIYKLNIEFPNVNLNLFEFSKNFNELGEWYSNELPSSTANIGDEAPEYCFHEDEDPAPCLNPEDFFFYDTLHPSTQVHYAISELLSKKFNNYLRQICPSYKNRFRG